MVTIIFKNRDSKLTPEKFFNKVQGVCGFPKADMVYYDEKNDISIKIGKRKPVNLGKYLEKIKDDSTIEWYLTVPHLMKEEDVARTVLEFVGAVGIQEYTLRYKNSYIVGLDDEGIDILTERIKQTEINREVYRKIHRLNILEVVRVIFMLSTKWKDNLTTKEQMLASIGRISMLMWSKNRVLKETNTMLYLIERKQETIIMQAKDREGNRDVEEIRLDMSRGILTRKVGDITKIKELFR